MQQNSHLKTFIIHIEWEGDGRKEEREIKAPDKSTAKYLAKQLIYNPSINYGYSYYITEKTN